MQHHIALMATVSLQNITPREALDSPTKPTFPSLCRGAASVSHPTKHSQEQKEKGQRWVWKRGYSTGTKFFQSLEAKPGEEINHGHTDKGPTLIGDQLSLGHQGAGTGEKVRKMKKCLLCFPTSSGKFTLHQSTIPLSDLNLFLLAISTFECKKTPKPQQWLKGFLFESIYLYFQTQNHRKCCLENKESKPGWTRHLTAFLSFQRSFLTYPGPNYLSNSKCIGKELQPPPENPFLL